MADGDNWRISGGRGRAWFPHGSPEDRKLRHPHLPNNSMESGDYSGGAPQGQPQMQAWAGPAWGQNQADPVITAMAAMSMGQSQMTANLQHTYAQNMRPTQPNIQLHFAPNIRPAIPNMQLNYVQNIPAPENNTLKSNLSPFAAPFVPRSLSVQQPLPIPEMNSSTTQEEELFDEEPYIIVQVRNIVSILTVSPGKFDILVPALAEEINNYVEDEFILDCVADVIFEESVSVPNVRYNGARICDVFSKKVKIPSTDKTFLQLLLRRCHKEHSMRAELMKTEISMERLRGFTLFLGELFVNMEITVNGTPQKFGSVGDALFELLETLLTQSNTDNLKCVGQLLKFAGAHLEDYDMSKCRSTPRVDRIFNTMENHTLNEEIHRSVREMLLRVMELRSTDWGRAVTTLPVRNEPPAPEFPLGRGSAANEAVLYGPDGQPLTLEEAQFLESSNGAFENDEEDEYDLHPHEGGWSTAEEMDEEMEAAYEKFLREQDDL